MTGKKWVVKIILFGKIHRMKPGRSIPLALQIVALLFLLEGIGSVIGMIARLFAGHVLVDFGFLGILAFFGLRRFSRGWRIFALVCLWVELIGCPVAVVLGFSVTGYAQFKLFGISVGQITPLGFSAMSAIVFILAVWQYQVLTRPSIRGLFFTAQDESEMA